MRFRTSAAAVAAAVIGLSLSTPQARAADHVEAPNAASDALADIADFYAWHHDGVLTTILTINALNYPGTAAAYDADVLYLIHIDNDGDNNADYNIYVRFGQDSQGSWGVQVEDMPGTGEPVIGAVGGVIPAPGGQVYVGLRDDPFFFDLDGYLDTLTTGTVSFSSARDSFAGTNATIIALEMDLASATEGSDTIQTWATTWRY